MNLHTEGNLVKLEIEHSSLCSNQMRSLSPHTPWEQRMLVLITTYVRQLLTSETLDLGHTFGSDTAGISVRHRV